NIGAPGRINYTIVGDAVNTGQRIEALAKEFDDGTASATVVFSGQTVSHLADAAIAVTSLGAFPIRGRSESVNLYRLNDDGAVARPGAL
ncbi:MAG: adenylate/guanylate cyclase domain-containing protein, partial [Alphaproteobacteria bacterium]